MGGFFGTTHREDSCVNDLYYGTDYNSHLGTRRAGITTVNNGKFKRSIHNIENTYFRSKFDGELHEFEGNAGIGVISDNDAQPIIVNSHLGKFAIVTVAKINNIAELQQELLEQGQHFCEHSNDIVNPTELVATLITTGKDFVEGICNVYRRVKGSCSMLLLLTDGSLIAARDRLGRTPIAIGCKEGARAAASESCTFGNLGYTMERELGPGEILRITPTEIQQLKAPETEMQICAFLWTYYGYAPCCYEGTNVDQMRYNTGYSLAQKDDVDIDFVSPIPDSGTGMALGYAAGKGKPYMRGMIKYTPTWPRSFTPTDQSRRELVAKMKLIPNAALLSGKNVAFCDDSIVRGTQLRDNVRDIRNAGANQVHVRISCPPLIYPCSFIGFTSSKGAMELITRRKIADFEGTDNPDEATLQRYATPGTPEHEKMVDAIRQELGLDSLRFATLDDVISAIGLPKERVCTHCFDGTSHY